MSEVRRYTVHGYNNREERTPGVYVLASDYDALRARLAKADAAVRAFVAWLEHDDTKPAYPTGTNRDSPGNEAIWLAWWNEAQDKCATALSLGRAYVRNADNGSGDRNV